eukprot:1158320-Pelagomonas_calceolata.AAC.8
MLEKDNTGFWWGRHGSFLNACGWLVSKTIKYVLMLLYGGMDGEENISGWDFPTSNDSSARHQNRPDTVFVRPIQAHIDPQQMPAQNRNVHLQSVHFKVYIPIVIELKYCPNTNPSPSLQVAAAQRADTIRRLCAHNHAYHVTWGGGDTIQMITQLPLWVFSGKGVDGDKDSAWQGEESPSLQAHSRQPARPSLVLSDGFLLDSG